MKKKIFVMVGSTYPFDRLIKEIDKFDARKFEVFAQIGESDFKPKNISFKKLLTYNEIEQKISWADIIITHAGAGTIIDCLKKNKQLTLFPRLKELGEAIDNHQIEICKAFEKKFGIKWSTNEKDLSEMLKKFNKTRIKKEGKLIKEIKKIINE